MSYSQPLEVTINDYDLDVVARNAIMLLIALVLEDVNEAIDCIIHVWYSVLLRKSDLDVLQARIRPLVESVCKKIKNRTPTNVLGKTWQFGQRSLRLVLEKTSWDRLLSFFDIPRGLTAGRAQQIRQAVTLAKSRKDFIHRVLLSQPPSRRIPMNRFREEGILLPFGSPCKEFQEPNP